MHTNASYRDERRGSAPIQLASVNSFRDTLESAQERMNDQIAKKLDGFFEIAEYDWTPKHVPSPQIVEEPSVYLIEMVDYLTLVMDSVLLQLPEALKMNIYRIALQHCAAAMMVRNTQ